MLATALVLSNFHDYGRFGVSRRGCQILLEAEQTRCREHVGRLTKEDAILSGAILLARRDTLRFDIQEVQVEATRGA